MKKSNTKWCRLTVHAIEKELHTDASCGLSCKEARLRYRSNGANTLFDAPLFAEGDVYFRLMRDPAWILLLFGCVIALCFGEWVLSVSVLACMSVVVLFSIFCYQREREHRKRIAVYRVPTVTVIRDGKRYTVSARGIVIGDLLLLRSGDIVPCDCRLAQSKNLSVQTLSCDEKGRRKYLPQQKCEKALYGFEEEVSASSAENMLCGGAKIMRGFAYAIAVAVGSDCELGGDHACTVPAESREGRTRRTSIRLLPYLRIYRFAVFAAFLPLTVIALLTSPANASTVTIFLSILAFAASASTAYLALFFHECEMKAERDALVPFEIQNRAVFKSERASASLSQITDLFVMGHSATSDGKINLLRAWLGDGELELEHTDQPITALEGLAEAFCLIDENAKRELPAEGLAAWNEAFFIALSEILHISQFDRDALLMRTLETRLLPAKSEENQTLEVRTHDRARRILFTSSLQWIRRCACFEREGKVYPFDPEQRQSLISAIEHRAEQNSSVQIVLQKRGCDLCLIGAVSFGERTPSALPNVLESLAACGIRTTFFFKGGREAEGRYAADLSLPKNFSYFQKTRSNQLSDGELIEKYRVLQGFTPQEVAELIQEMKRRGRKIAVMSVERSDEILLQAADLFIACNETPYHNDGPVDDTVFEQFSRDGSRQSADASQSMRRSADLLICRSMNNSGGLFALLQARLACCAVNTRAGALLSFLFFSQLTRLATVVLAACTGFGLPGATQLLYSGLIMETVGAYLLASVPIAERNATRASAPDVRAQFCSKWNYLAPIFGVACTMLVGVILMLCGVINTTEATSGVFAALALTGCLHLFIWVMRITSSRDRRASFAFLCTLMLIPPILMPVLSATLPSFGNLLGTGAWNPFTLITAFLMPILSLLFSHLFSKK